METIVKGRQPDGQFKKRNVSLSAKVSQNPSIPCLLSGWIILIYSGILSLTGVVSLDGSDKWRAP